MKILFIAERKIIPNAGGVERVTSLLAEEMNKRGHEIFYLSVGPEEWNKEEVEPAFPQYFIPTSAEEFSDELRSLIRRLSPDVAIIQSFNPLVLPAVKQLPAEIKKYLVYHNQPFALLGKERYVKRNTPWRDLKLKGKILKSVAIIYPSLFRRLNNRQGSQRLKHLMDHVDKLVLLSDRFVDRILSVMPDVDESKLLAVNNPNTFKVSTESLAGEKENIVLMVSRLTNPQKNLTGFIDVWQEFSKHHPDWKALILGDGEHRDIIERYAEKKGVANLSFEGNRKNVADYYRKAKLLCMTSAYEGWGMVLTEAMAYGCVPVVYDTFEALHDIVDNNLNGIVVPPFNTKVMAASLDKLASDEVLRQKMADAARNKIQNFNVENIVDRWEALLAHKD